MVSTRIPTQLPPNPKPREVGCGATQGLDLNGVCWGNRLLARSGHPASCYCQEDAPEPWASDILYQGQNPPEAEAVRPVPHPGPQE